MKPEGVVEIRGLRLCGVPSERRFVFPGGFPGLHPGLVCGAPSGPLIDEVGSVLDREVDSLPDEGMGSELWWWIGSNGATQYQPRWQRPGTTSFPPLQMAKLQWVNNLPCSLPADYDSSFTAQPSR